MSFRRPRFRKQTTSSPAKADIVGSSSPQQTPSTSTFLVPLSQAPRKRLAPRTGHLYLPGPERLVALGSGLNFTHAQELHPLRSQTAVDVDDPSVFSDNSPDYSQTYTLFTSESEELRRCRQQRKKERQWRTWTTQIIPSLIRPCLRLLRESETLRHVPDLCPHRCTCGAPAKMLAVICVHFECEFFFPIGVCI
jgi:hypothetical protein